MTNVRDFCGEITSSGLPCTLPKGHKVHYHRHRTYESITWTVETTSGITLDSGRSRVDMNNAISKALTKNELLVLHIKRWSTPVE